MNLIVYILIERKKLPILLGRCEPKFDVRMLKLFLNDISYNLATLQIYHLYPSLLERMYYGIYIADFKTILSFGI